MSLLNKALQPVATKIGQEVAEAVAPKAVKAAVQKSDEILGSDYVKQRWAADKKVTDMLAARGLKDTDPGYDDQWFDALWDEMTPLRAKAYKQLSQTKNIGVKDLVSGLKPDSPRLDDLMSEFYGLEWAGVPRAWTGKLLPPLFKYKPLKPELYGAVAKKLASATKELSKEQMETLVALLPEWTGSIDELIAAARML